MLLALSLLSKPTLVTLPCLFLVLDWWPLQRARTVSDKRQLVIEKLPPQRAGTVSDWRQLVIEKLPLLALILASCVVTFVAQQQGGRSATSIRCRSEAVWRTRWLPTRRTWKWQCGRSSWPMYPYVEGGWPEWRVGVSALLVGGLTLLAVWQRDRRPYLLTGWLWYLGTLVPVIGLVQVGDQAFADRYTYFPLIGASLAVVWTVAEIIPPTAVRGRWRVRPWLSSDWRRNVEPDYLLEGRFRGLAAHHRGHGRERVRLQHLRHSPRNTGRPNRCCHPVVCGSGEGQTRLPPRPVQPGAARE